MNHIAQRSPLGNTRIEVPKIIFGTSALGNLYAALPPRRKLDIMREWFRNVSPPVAIDTAGKYGAGLALEVIGSGLEKLGIDPDEVVISNKLGWRRTPLQGHEPTFEPGVWKDLHHDARLHLGYAGILECWEQGLELLGGRYATKMVSVHDPDEYIAAAEDQESREARFDTVMDSYRALLELKQRGEVAAVGVGAKDWKTIRRITETVELDWVMLALSFTVLEHGSDILGFMEDLAERNIAIINSAVFHGGFLTGGDFFNYRQTDRRQASDRPLYEWRDHFFGICKKHQVKPSDACIQFGLSHPAITAIALNTSMPEKIADNIALLDTGVPEGLFRDLQQAGLIDPAYPYV